MNAYILAHDLGTSGNKATLYDLEGRLCAGVVHEYPTYYSGANQVEQDAELWWKAVCVCTRQLIDKAAIAGSSIACVSFSGQMMGCLPVDSSGNPLRRSIIWADQRAVKQAAFIEKNVGMEKAYRITGHRISPSYSAAKILWIKDNEPDLFKKTNKILHAKDYIVLKLTGCLATDYSDASGMNLYDIEKKQWSDEILRAIAIDKRILPDAYPSTHICGKVHRSAAAATGLTEGTPVVLGGGDGSCATVGAGVVRQGKTYIVIGSSSWISLAASRPLFDPLMRTFNWIHCDERLYSPCGTMQTAGYALQWMKNTLCSGEVAAAQALQVSPYKLIDEAINTSKPGANNLLFLPYLLGERSPRWNPEARAAFIGLKMTNTKGDIYRSVLEGVGYNLKLILDIFQTQLPVNEVIAIGGGAKAAVWLQILADIWQKKIAIPRYLEEATSMGAAVCGGCAIGAFGDFSVIEHFNAVIRTVAPRPETAPLYQKLFTIFDKSYAALTEIYSDLAGLDAAGESTGL
jgi:xylulokinase